MEHDKALKIILTLADGVCFVWLFMYPRNVSGVRILAAPAGAKDSFE